MNERQQEIKALIEGHPSHKDQWIKEYMATPKFPSITLAELKEIKPLAEQISDRFHFAVCIAISDKERYQRKQREIEPCMSQDTHPYF